MTLNRIDISMVDGLEERLNKFVTAPTSSTSIGDVGNWSADANFLYICYAKNTWIRVAKSAW